MSTDADKKLLELATKTTPRPWSNADDANPEMITYSRTGDSADAPFHYLGGMDMDGTDDDAQYVVAALIARSEALRKAISEHEPELHRTRSRRQGGSRDAAMSTRRRRLVPSSPGNWLCFRCGATNSWLRTTCARCGVGKQRHRRKLREGPF